MSDVKALIAEAREAQYVAFNDNEIGYALIIRALADALEAVQQTPEQDERAARFLAMATPLGYGAALTVVESMTPLLEYETRAGAVQQTPAVDREALAHEVARWFPVTAQDPDEWALDRARLVVQSLIASGILQDAAEVEARGAKVVIAEVLDNLRGTVAWTESNFIAGPNTMQFLSGVEHAIGVLEDAQQVRRGNDD